MVTDKHISNKLHQTNNTNEINKTIQTLANIIKSINLIIIMQENNNNCNKLT